MNIPVVRPPQRPPQPSARGGEGASVIVSTQVKYNCLPDDLDRRRRRGGNLDRLRLAGRVCCVVEGIGLRTGKSSASSRTSCSINDFIELDSLKWRSVPLTTEMTVKATFIVENFGEWER